MAVAHKILEILPTTMPLSKKLAKGLASLRLEGITLSNEAISDLKELEDGKISEEECLNRAVKRARA